MSSDAGIELSAQIALSLGDIATAMQQEQAWRRRCAGAIQQVPVISNQVNGSGTIDTPDALAVKTGYIWGLRRLSCYGFSAGTVTVYIGAAGGEVLFPFDQAGTATFGRGEMLLMPGDRLVAVGAGITGTFQLQGRADCFEQWYLPYYIG